MTGVIGWALQGITCPMCMSRAERVLLLGLSIAQAGQVYAVGAIGRVVDGHQYYEGDYLCGASLRVSGPPLICDTCRAHVSAYTCSGCRREYCPSCWEKHGGCE